MERIDQVIGLITACDAVAVQNAQARLDNLTKPLGSLGRLEELAKVMCGITGSLNLSLAHKVIFVLAADHGVTQEGVSPYPKEVTAQMVYNFLQGGAGINVLASHVGARVVVADLGVASDLKPEARLVVKKINYGTKNMAREAAMSRDEAIRSLRAGIDLFEEEYARGINIVGTGEMGIGNTSAASAITASFTKKPVEEITGKGAGLNDAGLIKKIAVIKKALAVNAPDCHDPVDVLARVGGFEIGGLAGVMLAAAAKKVPVVIDGFISGAAALLAYHLAPKIKEYLIASHVSVESGHRVILSHIGLRPLFDLDLRLGEGTGAALGIGLADASVKILTRMATFESAQVSKKAG